MNTHLLCYWKNKRNVKIETYKNTYLLQCLDWKNRDRIRSWYKKCFHFIYCQTRKSTNWFTWHNVSKTYCGHRYEAEIEGIKEAPILPDGEERGAKAEEEEEEEKWEDDCEEIVLEKWIVSFLSGPGRAACNL